MTLLADEVYADLEPIAGEDGALGFPLRALVRAIGSMFAQPEEAIRALGNGEDNWERIWNPDLAPTWLLPFVAQGVGVALDTSLVREEQVAQIKAEAPWKRGTPAAIIRAAQSTLYSAMNLVPNPSFEHAGVPVTSSWLSSGTFITSGSTASPEGGTTFAGAPGIFQKIATGAVAKRGLETSVPGVFQSGVAYTASIYIKGNAGGEKVKLIFGSSVGPEEKSTEVTLTTGWQRVEVTWTPAVTRENSVELSVQHPEATAVTFFIDGALVTAGTTAPAYNDGDSEGWKWLGQPGESASVNVATPGAKRVRLIERNSTAYTLLIVTGSAETPDVRAMRAAATAAVPAGIIVTAEVSDLPLIDEGSREIDLATAHTIDTATLADVT